MARDEKKEGYSLTALVTAILLFAVSAYWQLAPSLAHAGYEFVAFNKILKMFKSVLSNTYIIRAYVLLFILASAMMKTTRKLDVSLEKCFLWSFVGTVIFMLPTQNFAPLYLLTGFIGMSVCVYGYTLFFRRMKGGTAPEKDSFLQCDQLIENEYSINIPYHYFYKKKRHDAWLNLVAPQRGVAVYGLPGSGKSYGVYNKCIEDMMRKGYTCLLYDFKWPDLTEELLNEIYYQSKYEHLWEKDRVKPRIYFLNFDDPERSHRCNPIHHSYITDPADTTEIADLLFRNINRGAKNSFDFFNESAKVYLDALAWFLANYDPDAEYEVVDGKLRVKGSTRNFERKGCFCTFPHIIELMACDYTKVFQILQFTHGLEAKISPFASALEGGAMEQLQGQIASAQIPLAKFVSPALYWIMTGDDFTLDINNPDEPKIVCLGNNPDRQAIYGSAIALYTSRCFKLINHKHKRKSAVLLDELPTVFLKGLDNLIATARSNDVVVVIGAQDINQLKRDYGHDEAQVVFNLTGTILSGQVNNETAKLFSEMFGKEFREQHSKSIGDDNESTSISFQLQEVLPAAEISSLSSGTFFGRIADSFKYPIERKLFCGTIDVDESRRDKKKSEWQKVPIVTDFFEGQEPAIPASELSTMERLYPKEKDNPAKLLERYKEKFKKDALDANLEQIKTDVQQLVDKMYEETLELAQKERERKKRERPDGN